MTGFSVGGTLIVKGLNQHTETKILIFVNTNGRPDMLTRNVLNEKFICDKNISYLNGKKVYDKNISC